MKHVFLVNPIAGSGKFQKTLQEKIEKANLCHGFDWEIHETAAPGDARQYVEQYDTATSARFYAVGGDGTLNEVVNGIMNRSGYSELALIPCGTGNDFVRVFSEKEPFFDMEKQMLAEAQPVDVFRTDIGLYGINMINIGFDADVAASVHQFDRFPGTLAYIIALLVRLCRKTGQEMEITVDDLPPVKGSFILSAFANGKACGGGFISAPKAEISDGLWEISAINNVPRRKFVGLIGHYRKGTHFENKQCQKLINYYRGRKATLKTAKPVNIVIDGEAVKRTSLTAEILPGALRFAMPE